jgi:hypothetical protein
MKAITVPKVIIKGKEIKDSPRFTKAIITGRRKKKEIQIILSCFEFPNRGHNR